MAARSAARQANIEEGSSLGCTVNLRSIDHNPWASRSGPGVPYDMGGKPLVTRAPGQIGLARFIGVRGFGSDRKAIRRGSRKVKIPASIIWNGINRSIQ